jgi:hypothetical protein
MNLQDKERYQTTLKQQHVALLDAMNTFHLHWPNLSVTRMHQLLKKGAHLISIGKFESSACGVQEHVGRVASAINLAKLTPYRARWPYQFSLHWFYVHVVHFILDSWKAATAEAAKQLNHVCQTPDLSLAVQQFLDFEAWPQITEQVVLGMIILNICKTADSVEIEKRVVLRNRRCVVVPAALNYKRRLPPIPVRSYLWTNPLERGRNRRCGHDHYAAREKCRCRLLLIEVNSTTIVGHRYYSPDDLASILIEIADTAVGRSLHGPLYFFGCSTPVQEILQHMIILPPALTRVTAIRQTGPSFSRFERLEQYSCTGVLGTYLFPIEKCQLEQIETQLHQVRAAGRRVLQTEFEMWTNDCRRTTIKTRARSLQNLVYPLSEEDDLAHLLKYRYFPTVRIVLKASPSLEFSRSIVCKGCAKLPVCDFILSCFEPPRDEGVHILCTHRTPELLRYVEGTVI